jgi:starvation-inducible DNA-binding protein
MLIDELKRVQADTFAMYNKAHYYHWNVEGADFVQYHEFLNDVYTALWEAVDDIAEQVRQLDAYAPNGKRMLDELTQVTVDEGIPDALQMFRQLHQDNQTTMEGIIVAYNSADSEMQIGLSNFLQDRMMYHKKLDWMLKSITKTK